MTGGQTINTSASLLNCIVNVIDGADRNTGFGGREVKSAIWTWGLTCTVGVGDIGGWANASSTVPLFVFRAGCKLTDVID